MRSLTILLLLAVLTACSNQRPAVERQSFLILTERSGAAARPVAGGLRVRKMVVASPFGDRPLVYRRSDVRYEVDFYNQFAADPSQMLTEAATGWLRQSGLFRQVMPPGAEAAADYRLEAKVSALYVDFEADPPAAVMNIRWQLVRESDGATAFALESRQRVSLAERSPTGAVRAYREALQQALGQLETALASAKL